MAESAPSRPPLALIANDQEWSIRSLESILSPHGYAILRAYTAQQAVDLALEASPDVVVLNMSLPDIPGIEVCRLLRGDPRISPCTPILITSPGRPTREERLEALRAGAGDLITLPLDAEEFVARLDAQVRLKVQANGIADESLLDQLTGLYNLRGMMRRAWEIGSDAYRHSRPLACVAFGPQTGEAERQGMDGDDEALWRAVDRLAKVFKSSGRISDAIGRVRLGEFLVIASGTDEEGARKLAQRLVAAAKAPTPGELQTVAGYTGVANARAAGLRPASLVAGATAALRQAQGEPGKDSIRRYELNNEITTSQT